MSFYPPKIENRCSLPKRAGKPEEADAVGVGGSFVCGAALKFYLLIDKNDNKIIEAKYQTNACGYTIAAAEILAEEIQTKKMAELHGLNRSDLTDKIFKLLGEFEVNRLHCLDIVFDALQKAFASYRSAQINEFAGDEALICTCFGITEKRIETLVTKRNLTTVEEVSALCNAGTGCGSCQFLIREIIDSYWQEQI